ncbi:MAG: YycH family regulatory protein [Lactobacillus sp.]|nr:hypothetical protein [Lactobacillus sp.]MDN6042573.1 hypothetical protein [Lactobacillus sp.]MDN6052442.1 hypothetical protein [Lactobacillus sp.]
MKFKKDYGDLLLHVATTAAILLSILLWIFIMTSDQRFNRINQPTAVKTSTRTSRSLYDLYAPTSLYGFKDGRLRQLYDERHNLSLEFIHEFKTVKLSLPRVISTNSLAYQRRLNDPSLLQLAFPDQLTFTTFDKKLTMRSGYREFNRIFLSASNKVLYFGNDKTNIIYKMNISGVNFGKLRQYAANANSQVPIRFVRFKDGYSVYYQNAIREKVYSYLVTHQADSYFVSRLLGTASVSSKVNKDNQTTYSLNYYNRLRVPSRQTNDRNYVYIHYQKNSVLSPTQVLRDSVYYVHRVGLNEQDIHFFDADGSNITYTNYIEGIPVFIDDRNVQLKTNFLTDSVRVQFNSTNFQIPIPFDGRTETLPPTQTVVETLMNRGISRDSIQKIIVGFILQNDNSHANLINLVPTYFVKVYGQWRTLASWKNWNMTYGSNAQKEAN